MRRSRRSAAVAALLMALSWGEPAAALPTGIEALAIEGLAVEGGAPGATHLSLGRAGVDDVGPFFVSQYETSPSPLDRFMAIFATDEMGDRYIKLPPTVRGTGLFFSTFAMSRESQLFTAGIDVSVGNGGPAVFLEDLVLGGFDPLAQTGTTAPSTATPGAQFDDGHRNVMITPSGAVAFGVDLVEGVAGVTADNSRAVWWTLPTGALEVVSQMGDPLPGLPAETAFPSLVDLSEAGALVSHPDRVVFHPKSGSPTVVGGVGQPLPDDSAESFVKFQVPRINDAGDIFVIGEGAVSGWHLFGPDGEGGLERWVSEGDAASQAGAGFTFVSFRASTLSDIRVNENGRVLFFATLLGGENPTALWVASGPGDLALIALADGDVTIATANAGAVPCLVFEHFSLLNDLGEVVFQCRGPNGSSSLLYHGDGNAALVAQEGQVWELEPGVSSTLDAFDVDDGLYLPQGTRPTTGLGDPGLAFRARFDGGTRAGLFFVAGPEALPEPGTGATSLAALVVLALRARRSRTPSG